MPASSPYSAMILRVVSALNQLGHAERETHGHNNGNCVVIGGVIQTGARVTMAAMQDVVRHERKISLTRTDLWGITLLARRRLIPTKLLLLRSIYLTPIQSLTRGTLRS